MSDAVYWITYVVTFTKLNVKVDLIESRVSRGNNLLLPNWCGCEAKAEILRCLPKLKRSFLLVILSQPLMNDDIERKTK